jgi:hypothetical protein
MPYSHAEFKQRLSDIVRDDADKLTPEEKDRHLQEAIRIYSKHRPREIVKEIAGDGNYDYSIASNLSYWIKGFSRIKSLEYPADEREPSYVDEDDFMVVEKEAGQYIHFLVDTPSATQTLRVSYTGLHILSDAENTIPESDQDAVCNLAASLCSGALAQAYALTSDSTISADSVDHRSKSQEFSSRAKVQKQSYLNHLALKEGDVPPASAIQDWEINYPDGTERLTHPRRRR